MYKRQAHKVVRIEDSAVVVTDMATGEEKSLPRDKVIVALGVKSDRVLYDEVKDRFQNVFNLGEDVYKRQGRPGRSGLP